MMSKKRFSERVNVGNTAAELVQAELGEYLEVKGIQGLTDSMVNTLLVHKPHYPVSHLVAFLAAEHKRDFRRALRALHEPLPNAVFSDSDGEEEGGEGKAAGDGVAHTRLPLSANLVHGERAARDAAAAAKLGADEQKRHAVPLAQRLETAQREVLARVATDYGLAYGELVARLVDGSDAAPTVPWAAAAAAQQQKKKEEGEEEKEEKEGVAGVAGVAGAAAAAAPASAGGAGDDGLAAAAATASDPAGSAVGKVGSSEPDAAASKPEASAAAVGRCVAVFWPGEAKWFRGTVRSFDASENSLTVAYEDGDEEKVLIGKDGVRFADDDG
jgi:hypothetical protein